MSSAIDSPLKASNNQDAAKRWYNDLVISNDPDHFYFMDDFVGVALDSTNDWTVVKDTGATVDMEADTVGGKLAITSAATTDNDGGSIQGNEIFAVAVGRYIHIETVVNFHDADDCDFFFGLSENFATNPEAVLTASNRIGFQVAEGSASILCKTEASDTETSTDSQKDAADSTDVTLGIKIIGTGIVEFYVDRVLVATHTTNIPTANMALALFHLSGSATGTFSMECDYIMAAMTR